MIITIFDIETYKTFFCLHAKDYDDNQNLLKEYSVRSTDGYFTTVNQTEIDKIFGPREQEHYIVSFNGNKFDLPVLAKLKRDVGKMGRVPTQYIYTDAQALISYDRFNNPVIRHHHSVRQWNQKHFDLLNCCLLSKSLKQWEMYHGLKIRELPYPPDTKLTPEQENEVLDYCAYDVWATAHIFFIRGYGLGESSSNQTATLLSYRELYKMLPERLKTNFGRTPASMAAAIIYQQNEPIPPTTINPLKLFDLQSFDVPIDLKILIAKLATSTNELIETEYRGINYGKGGAHYARKGLFKNLYGFDVASQYPSTVILWKLLKTLDALERFTKIRDDRLATKKDQLLKFINMARKLILNAITGAFRIKSAYSVAYDPAAGEAMCYICQLIISELAFSVPDEYRIEVNTDSVFVVAEGREACQKKCKELTAKYKMEFEEEFIPMIYFSDVNNYIVYKEDGSVDHGKGNAWSDIQKKNSNRAVYGELFRHLPADKLDLRWDNYAWQDFIVKYHKSAASKYATIGGESMNRKNYYFMWTTRECPNSKPISFSRDLINRQNGSIKARYGVYAFDIDEFAQYIPYIDYTQYQRDLDDEFELWNKHSLITTFLPKERRKTIKSWIDAL